MRQEMQGPYVV